MSALLLVLIFADGIVLLISYAQHKQAWADDVCYQLAPLCGSSNALVIVAIVLIGLRFALRT